jgi:hypothetical protein
MGMPASGSSWAAPRERNRGLSPRALSRIGGALYLAIIAIGAFGEMGIRNRIVVSGDALATAANLNALESLWRLGLAGELLLLVCGTTLAAIFYVLIRPVSRDGAAGHLFQSRFARDRGGHGSVPRGRAVPSDARGISERIPAGTAGR